MLMHIKMKKSGRLKGRGVADGRSQRHEPDYDKDNAASPTVSNEAVILTGVIDAAEQRDVAMLDIPGAYLHARMKDYVLMLLDGTLAEMMVKVAPEMCSKYVQHDKKGKPLLCVRVQKATCGCLKSALLFCEKLTNDLRKMGFALNPHDPCVANKIVERTQITIAWHVDDLKISHASAKEVTKMIKRIEDLHGEVRVKRGKIHDYLGMTLDFAEVGKMTINITDYTVETVEMFPEEIGKKVATPATEHLCTVDPDAEKLNDNQKQKFHTMVARNLFASKRGRPDILTATAFLCTRVKEPDVDDWKKLRRLITYLHYTKDAVLTLAMDNVNIVK